MTSLAIAIAYELPAYLSRLLPPPIRRQRLAEIAIKAMNRFVACARTYIGLQLRYERPSFNYPKHCIIVSNHQSLLDIPILMHYFKRNGRILFVAKKELGYGVPLISTVLKLGGHALIDRGTNPSQSMRNLGSFARRCSTLGFWPSIFPEGTRSKDGCIGKFHSAGLRRIMEMAPAPFLVVAIDGGWKATKLNEVISGKTTLIYRVKALSVIEAVSGKKSVTAALEAAHVTIAAQLQAWRDEESASL